jgi:hypothetical protein
MHSAETVSPRTAAIIVLLTLIVGVAGRTVLDSLIAQRAGAAAIAHWAQISSLVELTGAVASAGLAPALTVLIARTTDPKQQVMILRDALWLSLGFSILTAIALAAYLTFIPTLAFEGAGDVIGFALATGVVAAVPMLVMQAWQAKGQGLRTLALSLVSVALSLFFANQNLSLPSPWKSMETLPASLLLATISLALPLLLWNLLLARRAYQHHTHSYAISRSCNGLLAYLPTGLSIGLLGPLALILAREQLGSAVGWESAATVQAIWRSAEWSAALLSGMLSLYCLPRFARAAAGPQSATALRQELKRTLCWLWLPAGVALMGVNVLGPDGLAELFSLSVRPAPMVLATFLLAEWIRMASWVLLQVLFATSAQWAIAIGELFSLPLFALLLWLHGPGLSLQDASLAYLLAYVAYLGFNLLWVWPRLMRRV